MTETIQDADRVCFRSQRRIEFSDTDVAGIVHFSRFFVFMETAEHQFLNSIGTSVHAEHDGEILGWPRLMASCEFSRPVRFEDTLDIELAITRLGNKSVTYTATFHHQGALVARGRIASVCCIIRAGGRPQSVPIPPDLVERLKTASS